MTLPTDPNNSVDPAAQPPSENAATPSANAASQDVVGLPLEEDTDPYFKKVNKLLEVLGVEHNSIPNITMLWGYLVSGATNKAGEIVTNRLYLNAEFSEFIEFSADPLVMVKAIPLVNELFPLSGVMVWINRSARVRYTQTLPVQRVADFLSGDITDTFSPQVEMPNLPRLRRHKRGAILGDDSYGGCGSDAVAPSCPV